jgi:hypothetical protein
MIDHYVYFKKILESLFIKVVFWWAIISLYVIGKINFSKLGLKPCLERRKLNNINVHIKL